ncbi:GNAT family protein [Clostridium sp. BNL1100]|uniref:GNAT family N-acetyltransferase n=1 Tax=Clostridium sp. BNL1100 TaxID=755731 RepID=UPI00024A72BF|nr:GNAT family protein [Clostridium sp. BNL1100]AEY66793.1 acetyltransferase, ribosomal protein N-acetylase [Clostridium sp. BNL1100]
MIVSGLKLQMYSGYSSQEKEEPRKFIRFAIILKSNNRLIGECGLNCPIHFHKGGEIVYRLSKEYWGRGYATESVKEVISFGFKELSLHRIDALCDSRNLDSIKVLQKAGMIYEGCMREHRWVKERWRDSVLYSIPNTEYKAIKLNRRT